MSEPNAISDHAPSPWWPCPECGGVHFKVTCCWERGNWPTPDAWEPFDPPNAKPTGVSTLSECIDCGTVTDLASHYDWPVVSDS